MAYPQTYYVIPEHHLYLSDDRADLIFDQHLPGILKDDIKAEVLEKSICLNIRSQGNVALSRCYGLPYDVDPNTAVADFKDNVLHIKVRLKEAMGVGRQVEL